MFGARAAGGYPYNEGHRLCVLCSHGGSLKKTSLQSAFGDFGHIVQIETPKPGLAFIAFADKNDATDAMRDMDGKAIDGHMVTVSKAGPKPVYKDVPNENPPQLLKTTQTEHSVASASLLLRLKCLLVSF